MSNNGPLITQQCSSCPIVVSIRLYSRNANIRKNGQFICGKCARGRAGAAGRYDRSRTRDLSHDAEKLWQNKAYADTISQKVSMAWTPKRRKHHAQIMKLRWQNIHYRESMLAKLREFCINNKQFIIEQLLKHWQSPVARENRSRLSTSMWAETNYRELVTKTIKDSFTTKRRLAIANENSRRWQDICYRDRVKSAISKTLLELWQNEKYRAKWAIGRAKQPSISSLQIRLYDYLNDIGVNYFRESDKTTIGFYSFDCLIPHQPRSILIECQGNYWHSLPKAIRNDRSKFTYINRYFPEYEIMYLWEHEFSTKDRVLDRLKLKLGLEIATESYEFKDLAITLVDRKTANDFLGMYHYLTASRGGVDHGLWLDQKLIAICRFSPLPRQNMAHQFPDGVVELSRLCVHPNYHKKNLISWWLSKLVKNYHTIITFADTTVGHTGTSYKASNFKLHHEVPADYWYVDSDGYVMHKKTLYNRAVNLKLTESEFAAKYGYVKKWGGKKLCFIYNQPEV